MNPTIGTKAFTNKASRIQLELRTECQIAPAYDPRNPPATAPTYRSFQALWDTGATGSAVSQRVVSDCSLDPIGMARVHGVHGEADALVYLVNILLPANVGIAQVRVTDADLGDLDVLIGMDIITRGDFSVTNAAGHTQFSFRVPSQKHIDFVEDVRAGRSKVKQAMKVGKGPRRKR